MAHTVTITVRSPGTVEAMSLVGSVSFLASKIHHEHTSVVKVHDSQGMEGDVGHNRQVLEEGKRCVH